MWLSLSLSDHSLWEWGGGGGVYQLPCHEAMQAVLWGGIWGEELKSPINSQNYSQMISYSHVRESSQMDIILA